MIRDGDDEGPTTITVSIEVVLAEAEPEPTSENDSESNSVENPEINDPDIFDIESIKNIALKKKEYMCIHFTNCSHLEDIIDGDKIGLMNNNLIIDVTSVVLKTEKYLLCNLIRDKKYDYDQLINLSVQNKIYCEKS